MTTTTAPAPAPTATKAKALAHYTEQAAQAVAPRRFATVYCSQCGAEFHGSPRDGGFSSCREHTTPDTHTALFARLRGAL